ncbi:MAG: phosphoribosylamine--glycine ligase [Bacillota bacterium]|nr:phosphoribosylamine--glycine ligase [Bacillota bacterium]MDD3297377.1 phosphoribosylamine--glycine ligase [Bacillota bacterium]MDD4707118.1 phosphoribosylamine--glycine ligase [Bacillota bacterium]
MKVLIVGSGGREHTLAWKVSQSLLVDKVYAAPGNGGMADIAQCVDIKDTDIKGLREFAQKEGIDLTVVGPETPLVAGIADEFQKYGLRVFGPNAEAALLEGSKVFSKEFMKRNGIPTGDFKVFEDFDEAMEQVDAFGFPVVIKADGLAAGKGVIIAKDRQEAEGALKEIMIERKFGSAGDRVLVEEFLTGTEMTILCFVDASTMVPMESARDYKRIFDDDKGPNTGGMGTFSPNDVYTPEIKREFRTRIMLPMREALKKEGIEYRGVLYFGLMVTGGGIKVLEFNCRFGDPETQVILPRLESDLVEIMNSVVDGRLSKQQICWSDKSCVCIILASGGYPGSYKKELLIEGLEQAEGEETFVFHAGTKKEQGKYYTNGGRVMGVTALGADREKARTKAYAAAGKVRFEGMQYRRDIAK